MIVSRIIGDLGNQVSQNTTAGRALSIACSALLRLDMRVLWGTGCTSDLSFSVSSIAWQKMLKKQMHAAFWVGSICLLSSGLWRVPAWQFFAMMNLSLNLTFLLLAGAKERPAGFCNVVTVSTAVERSL